MASRNYKYYQPNKKDLKDEYGDCVVRSLTKAVNKEWMQVFEELLPYARELQCMPNGKSCYEKYLTDNGFEYIGISNKKGSKRPTVDRFAKDHKNGIYVLVVASHLVSVVDGIYYDTWDSGKKCLYGYWEKRGENMKKESCKIKPEEKAEFIGQIIDVFEDFLEEKGIEVLNDEKEGTENEAIIYGSDYGNISTEIETLLNNWKLISQ